MEPERSFSKRMTTALLSTLKGAARPITKASTPPQPATSQKHESNHQANSTYFLRCTISNYMLIVQRASCAAARAVAGRPNSISRSIRAVQAVSKVDPEREAMQGSFCLLLASLSLPALEADDTKVSVEFYGEGL